MIIRRAFTFAAVVAALVTGLAASPSGAGPLPSGSGLYPQWQRTWNHALSYGPSTFDAFDVANSVAAVGDSVYSFGYAEDVASSYEGALTDSFLTRYEPDGDQAGDNLMAFSGNWDQGEQIVTDGNYLFMSGTWSGGQFLSVLDTSNSTYTFPVQFGSDHRSYGDTAGGMTAHAGTLYVLADTWTITRDPVLGNITKWTHEIHLKSYDAAGSLVSNEILTPEVDGFVDSDDTGIYVLGAVVQDYDINDPPATNPPILLTKFSFDGTMLWQQPVSEDTATTQTGWYSMAVEQDAVYVAGSTRTINDQGPTGPANLAVKKLTKLGAPVWSNVYDAGAPTKDKWYPFVDAGTTGVYVAADLVVHPIWPGDDDVVVLKIGFDGTALATAQWGGASEDYPQDAVAVGDDFYVTGYTLSYRDPSGRADAFLLKYAGSDTTAPIAAPAQTPQPNSAGWNKTDVTVNWNWTDAAGGSGIDPAHCTTTSVSPGEGVLSLNATCADLAGNTSTASHIARIDKTSPSLAPDVSPNPVIVGGVATASSGATDTLSGVATDSCGTPDTATVGLKSVICTATDNAGNSASATVDYRVEYAFGGFLPPVRDSDAVNEFKAREAIPIRFQLTDANGGYISALAAVSAITYKRSSCDSFTDDPTGALNAVAVSRPYLRYDTKKDQYVFNWASSRTGCYTLFVVFEGGQTEHAYFRLT
jgi:hypothetical protein